MSAWPGICFTVYWDTTTDFPGFHPVRPYTWAVKGGAGPVPWPIACVCRNHELDVQRSLFLMNGLVAFSPTEGADDPVIMETWI